MEFSTIHMYLLYEMINNPSSSIKRLQEKLDNDLIDARISYHLTKKAYDELKNMGILRKNRKINDPILVNEIREISEVEGNIIPGKLGLVTQHVFFKNVQSSEGVDLFADICYEHPYTSYRTVCVGEGIHLYAQFNIPAETIDLMNEFYERVRELVGANKIVLLNQDRKLSVELDMNNWCVKDKKWKFDMLDNSLYIAWNSIKVPNTLIRDNYESYLKNLDAEDLYLVRELNINAKVKPVDLAPLYNKDDTTISRRLKKLNNHVMEEKAMLIFDRNKFDVGIALLILGRTSNAINLNKLYKLLENNTIPFRASLISDGFDFRMIIYAPSSQFNEIAYFIWSKAKNVEIMTLSVDYKKSWIYPFYPENYDVNTKYWKISREYVLDDVLRKFEKR